MVNSDRYPHVFKYSTPGSGGDYNDDTGTYDPVIPGETHELPCRAKPNSSGKQERFQDNTVQVYAFDLGFPLGTQEIPEGVTATIIGVDGVELFKGPLLRYQKGVYSIRGWI